MAARLQYPPQRLHDENRRVLATVLRHTDPARHPAARLAQSPILMDPTTSQELLPANLDDLYRLGFLPSLPTPGITDQPESDASTSTRTSDFLSRPFDWTPKAQQAALMLAEGVSIPKIQRELDVTRGRLTSWGSHPQFKEQVALLREELRIQILEHGIASKLQRVKRLDDAWERLQQVIRARAEYAQQHVEDYVDVPGAQTGIVNTRVKVIGQGPAAREVTESFVDTELLQELRATEQQAAKELGQWTDKSEVTLAQKAYIGVDVDRV